jgi:antitoxin component of RelBE/YafQ-DinJ toxin-antitoxin module
MPNKEATLALRVQEREVKAWKRAAEESGLTLSAWVRIMLNGQELTAAKR